jgi:hypothetical protein
VKKVLALAAFGSLLILAAWLALDLSSGTALSSASTAWTGGSSLEATMAGMPDVSTNEPARRLELAAADIGFALRERSLEPHAGALPDQAFTAAFAELRAWLQAQLEEPAGTVAPPSDDVARFLASNGDALSRARLILLEPDTPRWALRFSEGNLGPIPNLMGHITLHRLLVASALAREAAGDHAGAWDDLAAARRLAATLDGRPELISTLIRLSEVKMVAVAMRKIDAPPPAWALEVTAEDLGEGLLRATAGEAAMLKNAVEEEGRLDGLASLPPSEWSSALAAFLRRPLQQAVAGNVIDSYREAASSLEEAGLCSEPALEERRGWWRHFAGGANPEKTISESWRRGRDAALQIEGTRLVLLARSERSQTGSWPATLAEKGRCGGWEYAREGDRASITYRSPIDPAGPGSLPLAWRSD